MYDKEWDGIEPVRIWDIAAGYNTRFHRSRTLCHEAPGASLNANALCTTCFGTTEHSAPGRSQLYGPSGDLVFCKNLQFTLLGKRAKSLFAAGIAN